MVNATSPPLWFLLANRLPFGRYKALHILRRMNLLDNRIVNVPFYDQTVKLPLTFVNGDLSKYQLGRISTFASVCDEYLGNYDFIDCGAHLGLFSAQFTVLSDRVEKLIAIEPNPLLFSLLEYNLQNTRAKQVQFVNAALADYEGLGRLVEAGYDPSPDAMYLEDDPNGDVQVTTLSALLRNRTAPNVAIKVDVEGLEVTVLCEAADAIRSLTKVVLFVEIHETVLERIGMSDVEMLKKIEAIRPFSWIDSDYGTAIDSKHPILVQLKRKKQCDLIGIG